jgi:hypothetical protein
VTVITAAYLDVRFDGATPAGYVFLMSRTLRISFIALAALLLALPAFGQAAERRQSTWQTDFGTVTLVQEGPVIWGTYDYHGGRITGSMNGGKFYGFWWEDDDATGAARCGPCVFVFDAVGTSFKGTYGKHSRGESTFWTIDPARLWNGTRTGGSIDLVK